MLSLERVKEIMNGPDLTDQQIEEIRDSFQRLAEIVFEKWQEDEIKRTKAWRQYQDPCQEFGLFKTDLGKDRFLQRLYFFKS